MNTALYRLIVVFVLSAVLCACARPSPQVIAPLPDELAVESNQSVTFFTATDRNRLPDDSFGDGRSYAPSFEEFKVSIPPRHKDGEIEWARSAPGNPARSFVTLSRRDFDEQSFSKALQQRMRTSKDGEVFIFVHGYNNRYQEAVYRMAQLLGDSDYKGAAVLYSWPSAGKLSGYLRDRESAAFSRDRLVHFIAGVAKTPGVKTIHILAHSMGGALTMEALRTAALMGNPKFGGKLGMIILASPDIDSDVFLSQIEPMGKDHPPIVILVNRNDKALYLSRRIAGDIPRLGDIDPESEKAKFLAERYNLTIIDTTDVPPPDSLGHSDFTSKVVLSSFQQAKIHVGTATVGIGIMNAAGHVLFSPADIIRNAAAP